MGKRLIVAGDRTFGNYGVVADAIEEQLGTFDEIVSGGARGVDTLGEQWANNHGVKLTVFKAEWNKFGKAAGVIRNRQMAEYADSLLAFLKPTSKGTKNMITVATKLGLEVTVVKL